MKQEWHDGRQDGLTPLEALDLNRVSGFADLLRAMSKTAFGGRALGEAHDVLTAMVSDPDCTIIVTVSGAMTVAKMGRILCDMIDSSMAHIIVCTGALVAHGLSEAVGGVHYRHDPKIRDTDLYRMGYNRVYDTLEMEANLYNAETVVSGALNELDWSSPTSSHQICAAIGKRLVAFGHKPSILGNAYERGVPVYVPAFTDSELGVDIAAFMLARQYTKGKEADLTAFFDAVPPFNPYLDLYDFTIRALRAKKLGIFTIGGGVPRNWGQQAAPFVGVLNSRMKTDIPHPRIYYAVRICPEPEHWGGLSGCSYTEGVSWGKFVSREEGGRFAEVHCDATIAWPLLIKAVLETKRAARGNADEHSPATSE